MPRYKLRTLLILLAIGPPMLAACWVRYSAWREEQRRKALVIAIDIAVTRAWIDSPVLTVPVTPPQPVVDATDFPGWANVWQRDTQPNP